MGYMGEERRVRSLIFVSSVRASYSSIRQVHIHRPFLKKLVSHLVTHYVYDTIFERHFVEQTQEYFSKESYQMVEVEKTKAKLFLAHCNQRTNEEQGRARDLMPDGTVALVKDTAIRALFEGRLEWMAKEG
jgi:cullin-4